MKTHNWKKVSEILLDCLEVETSNRRKFLDDLKISPEVSTEVESLLAFETETEDFMTLSANEISRDFFSFDESGEKSFVAQQIGIYKIIKELGFGGMGAVFLAERTDGKFEQEVAIKLLKREFNVEKIRRIFRREREILAALTHPNIARLLDAGKTGDGIPYLVMEYIEGVPVDKFCLENSLELNERLKIFNKICEAVAFAHRNLIIHRDLKPSNILITKDGETKLLDFGISKLLDESAETPKNTTLFGAMTPEYASPEQIRGETVSTATDIYSLGVVLYKMLTGTFPKDDTDTRKEEDAGTEGRGDAENENKRKQKIAASPRRRVPASFHRRTVAVSEIKGDLKNIIGKSLSDEPERRYQTVEQFSADIWRFIDGLPVTARSATFSYRAGKFYNRNKISVIAAALMVISLLAGISVAVRQTNVAKKQARIANESQKLAELETVKAKSEKEKSEKISQFMAKVISYANPRWYAEGAKFDGDVKIIDVLDDLTDKIETEFAGQPDIQAELHHKFSEVYNGRGTKEAREKQLFHARRALKLRKQFYGEKHELIAKDMYYLCAALKTFKKPDHEKIAKISAESIEMMRETNPNNLNLPFMLQDYSIGLMMPYDINTKENFEKSHKFYLQTAMPPTDKNKYQLAENYLREALPIYRKYYKEDNQAIAQNECILAYSLLMQNKMTDFERYFTTCKDLDKKPNIDSKGTINIIEDALAKKSKFN